MRSLDSLRDTFKSAEPFGSAFVPAVFYRYNPFWPDPEPFLSQYQGTLRIARPGLYRFFTPSQDCSFLLIDGKLVVAAPGRHGPVHDSRIKGDVNLSAGPHEFQYLHAAAGADTCMVAAWQPPGSAMPEPIPPEAFGSEAIGQYPAIGVKHLHEYSVDIAGEVPLAGSDLLLVRVQFRSVSTRASAARPKIHWDFGDGQTSTLTDPLHIYLLPGLYTVTMKVSGEFESLATTNRVPIHRALVFADQNHPPDQLGSYLTILDKYDPAKLDPPGLLQLVRAFDEGSLFARAAKAGQAGILAEREPMDSDNEPSPAASTGSGATGMRARTTDPRPGPPTLEPWPRWARENPPSSKTPGAAPTAGRPRSSSATKPLTGPGPSSAAGRRNTPSIRSKATSRCCKRATGRRGTSGRKQSRWPGTSLRSTPTLPTPTASSSWPPSARRKTAAVTALAPRINRCSPIIPAARWSQKPGRSSRC
ncbi:MAG: PKD domain-containing protein [Isosphaeraceae bacterium]